MGLKTTKANPGLAEVGGKAFGLYRVQKLMPTLNALGKPYIEISVPPFFVVPSELDLEANANKITRHARKLNCTSFAVRSSSPLEDLGEHSFDGIFHTELNVPLPKILQSIKNVRNSAITPQSTKYADGVGVKLDDRMPVIVQAMSQYGQKGEAYSRFPSRANIVKVITESPNYLIHCFLRRKPIQYPLELIVSSDRCSGIDVGDILRSDNVLLGQEHVASVSLSLEEALGYPIIMEYGLQSEPTVTKIDVLQARKLTNLDDKGNLLLDIEEGYLVASTIDVNSAGQFTGIAYVVPKTENGYIAYYHPIKFDETRHKLIEVPNRDFDEQHSAEGYVLVTPYLSIERSSDQLDEVTPHKRAIITFDYLPRHCGERARKSGVLSASCSFLRGLFENKPEDQLPIRTGDKIRIVSDGMRCCIYNLSRNPYF